MHKKQQSRHPILKAITYICRQKKETNSMIIEKIVVYELVFKCIQLLLLKLKEKKILKKIDLIKVQNSLTVSDIQNLCSKFEEGNYSEDSYLLPQFTIENDVKVLKDVFVYGKIIDIEKSHSVLVNIDSNELLNKDLYEQYRKIGFGRLELESNIQLDGHQVDLSYAKYQFPKLIPEIYNHSSLIQNISQRSKLDQYYVKNHILNKLTDSNRRWLNGIMVPYSVNIDAFKNSMCIQCSAVIFGNQVRLTNVKAIGSSFAQLRRRLISHYNYKIELLNNTKTLVKVGMMICIAYLGYSMFKYFKKYLKDYAIMAEYPRIKEVKRECHKVYYSKSLLCTECRINICDIILIPCYHMQICKECMTKQGAVNCHKCNEIVFCGIPLFTSC